MPTFSIRVLATINFVPYDLTFFSPLDNQHWNRLPITSQIAMTRFWHFLPQNTARILLCCNTIRFTLQKVWFRSAKGMVLAGNIIHLSKHWLSKGCKRRKWWRDKTNKTDKSCGLLETESSLAQANKPRLDIPAKSWEKGCLQLFHAKICTLHSALFDHFRTEHSAIYAKNCTVFSAISKNMATFAVTFNQ